MWFEILPSFAIITTALTLPPIFVYFGHKLTQNGNAYRRDFSANAFDIGLYRRDEYLTGNPYVLKGLETIPDED